MTDIVGHKGEAIAAKYYQQRGWLLLNHNYRTRMGEIDLILYKENTLVFAEVKTRAEAGRCIVFPAHLSAEKHWRQRMKGRGGHWSPAEPSSKADDGHRPPQPVVADSISARISAPHNGIAPTRLIRIEEENKRKGVQYAVF